MRPKTYRFPDEKDDIYTDTTFFDKENKYLDVGYQRLKILNIKLYPGLSDIKILHISNNSLQNLPESKYLQNLVVLDCSHNKLTTIPFYPNLRSLTCCNNRINNLSL